MISINIKILRIYTIYMKWIIIYLTQKLMKNENYTPVQIPNDSYDILKEYCRENAYTMGKFIGMLIKKNCRLPDQKLILRMDKNEK